MLPLVGRSSKLRQRKKVLLPEPDGPMMTTFSLRSIVSEIPFKTANLPNCFFKSLTSITLRQPFFKNGKDFRQSERHYQI